MKIIVDFSNYEPWSGAVSTYERIQNEGKLGNLETILEDIYPDGLDETALNDLLWFDSDAVFEWLGLPTESGLNDAIREKQEELQSLLDDWAEIQEDEDYTDEEREEMWKNDYEEDIKDLEEEIKELELQLAEL